MSDCSAEMVEAVAESYAKKQSLTITGGGTKTNILGRAIDIANAPILNVSAHTGIVDYQPSELVLTARAGTTLSDITAALASEGQMLSFEPPLFDGRATLGGTLAGNLSGPARPWAGAIRDMVLGVQLINGKGELLNFGGQVMKNVAGYDVSRLQAGALGTLGVLSQISLKVLPKPEYSTTLCYQLNARDALEQMNIKSALPKPLSGACWVEGHMFLRLSGAADAVNQTAKLWGGGQLGDDAPVWRQLREMTHPFFHGNDALWRFSQRPTSPVQEQFGDTLIDWSGAQRWVRGEHPREALERAAEEAGGHVSLFRGGDRRSEVKHNASKLEQRLHQRLKYAFDPAGILNPGRMYSWM